MVSDELGAELDELRKLRNRIHIKSLEEPECMAYSAKMANDSLDLLERYRCVAKAWTLRYRAEELQKALDAGITGATARAVESDSGPRPDLDLEDIQF